MAKRHIEAWWQNTFPAGQQYLTITDVNGESVKIAYGEVGSGQTLVLLHGWGNWSYSWRDTIPVLASRYRVLCLDAKGQGFSDKPTRLQPMGHQIHDTAQMLQAISDKPVVLIGESLGGVVALAVAEQYPQLLKQLIVISPAVYPKMLPSFGMRLLTRLPMGLVKRFDDWQLVKPFAPLFRFIVRHQQREVVHQRQPLSDDELFYITYPYIHLQGAIQHIVADSQAAARELIKAADGSLLQRIQAQLNTIDLRTLVIWGQCDKWFPVADAQRLDRALPNSQLHTIPECGHSVAIDCPQAMNNAIMAFLADEVS